jgi:hypothetical protein
VTEYLRQTGTHAQFVYDRGPNFEGVLHTHRGLGRQGAWDDISQTMVGDHNLKFIVTPDSMFLLPAYPDLMTFASGRVQVQEACGR